MRTTHQTIFSSNSSLEWEITPGLTTYPTAETLMKERVAAIQNHNASQLVWLLEHPDLYTLGTSGKNHDVLQTASLPIFTTGRGGQVTYHGPGQRIIYVILDLTYHEKDLHKYIYKLEEWIIKTLAVLKIDAVRRKGRVGIWVEKNNQDFKIASIGVRVQKWITSHGIALNVCPDLSHFQHIIPCGLNQYGVTSIKVLGIDVTMDEIDEILYKSFFQVF